MLNIKTNKINVLNFSLIMLGVTLNFRKTFETKNSYLNTVTEKLKSNYFKLKTIIFRYWLLQSFQWIAT